MESSKAFERLNHQAYDGRRVEVPVLMDPERGITDESRVLLHAADIIATSLHERQIDVLSYAEELAQKLHDNEQIGIIIEDQYGKGSLNITPTVTQVRIREVGSWEVPTTDVFDMMFSWAELEEQEV